MIVQIVTILAVKNESMLLLRKSAPVVVRPSARKIGGVHSRDAVVAMTSRCRNCRRSSHRLVPAWMVTVATERNQRCRRLKSGRLAIHRPGPKKVSKRVALLSIAGTVFPSAWNMPEQVKMIPEATKFHENRLDEHVHRDRNRHADDVFRNRALDEVLHGASCASRRGEVGASVQVRHPTVQ